MVSKAESSLDPGPQTVLVTGVPRESVGDAAFQTLPLDS